MRVQIFPTGKEMAAAAAYYAADTLRSLLSHKGAVRLLAATGASQIDFLDRLTSEPAMEWGRVELFHLDEYVGIGWDHPASFARYIRGRIVDPTGISHFHLIDGLREPWEMAAEMGRQIALRPIDLAFVGIGENGHLAFNDPPADFETEHPYLVVELDEACRKQQVGEGWFPSFENVPRRAITISIPQLLQTKEIICVVPEARKAEAVRRCLEGPISPLSPASALQTHPAATIFLDAAAASLLGP